MFYCRECGRQNEWPTTLIQTDHACEICGVVKTCSSLSAAQIADFDEFNRSIEARRPALSPLYGQNLGSKYLDRVTRAPVVTPEDQDMIRGMIGDFDTSEIPDVPEQYGEYTTIELDPGARLAVTSHLNQGKLVGLMRMDKLIGYVFKEDAQTVVDILSDS